MGRKKTRYSELNIKIGQRIKDERLRLGLSCQKLADRIDGIESGNNILYWEKGSGVSIDFIKQLADVFNVRIEYLICKDDFREKNIHVMTPKEIEAWHKFERNTLLEGIRVLDSENYELRKTKKMIDLSNIMNGSSIGLLDGVKLSKQELQTLKTIIGGIRSNRKEVDNS